eukprot:TRINITY_DN26440_c0_g1_i1.p1 TRINITY_DN26440_c0_g1~~TRINITY_DN26440_c0_g1_i1.p1  ORF type:complete len:259 (+),score=50.31 TRINITY_DN26440_c0_g1_i1:155-931(+)
METPRRSRAQCLDAAAPWTGRRMPTERELLAALRADSSEQVQEVLVENPCIIISPILCGSIAEPVMVKAVRLGCSTEVLKTLRRFGASVNGGTGTGPLAALAGAPEPAAKKSELSDLVNMDALTRDGLFDVTDVLQGLETLYPPAPSAKSLPDLGLDLPANTVGKNENLCIKQAAWLILEGADASLRDGTGKTAADWAAANQLDRLAVFLRRCPRALREWWILDQAMRKRERDTSSPACSAMEVMTAPGLFQRVKQFL